MIRIPSICITLVAALGFAVTASATSLDIPVNSSTDDAEERPNGRVSLTSSDLELVREKSGDQIIGIRFNDVNIPRGTAITSAYIQFTVDETDSEATTLLIEGEATDHADKFRKTAFGISQRPTTGAMVEWESIAPWSSVGAAGPAQQTPDIAAIVQEIIDRPGWASGNSLAFIITGTGKRVAESYNGSPSAAPRLHIEYDGVTTNQAPDVNAGPDAVLTIPNDTVVLDATVSDDGLPDGNLNTEWTHVGGTGNGTVTFGDPSALTTTATFTPADPGTYRLHISADDGELSAHDELVVTLSENTQVTAITQVNYVHTGFDSSDNPLEVPAIDPAGLVYHAPSQRLFIADSEINEVSAAFNIVQANLFETSPSVDMLFDQWDLTQRTGNEPALNREPTGIAFCAGDDHFYVSNDDTDRVYRYAYDGRRFTAVDAISTRPYSNDPEGITCDPVSGRIYVIGGADINILVYEYNAGFVLRDVLDLPDTAGTSSGIPDDPEGITYDPVSGHLFVMSGPDRSIYEYTSSGLFIQEFDISSFSPRPKKPQGISIGASSVNPGRMSFYIADGRVDNDYDPNERDGIIYEAEIQRSE
jgi:hypothetical protein